MLDIRRGRYVAKLCMHTCVYRPALVRLLRVVDAAGSFVTNKVNDNTGGTKISTTSLATVHGEDHCCQSNFPNMHLVARVRAVQHRQFHSNNNVVLM